MKPYTVKEWRDELAEELGPHRAGTPEPVFDTDWSRTEELAQPVKEEETKP